MIENGLSSAIGQINWKKGSLILEKSLIQYQGLI